MIAALRRFPWWGWIWLAVMALWLVGVSQPDCCGPGPFDEFDGPPGRAY